MLLQKHKKQIIISEIKNRSSYTIIKLEDGKWKIVLSDKNKFSIFTGQINKNYKPEGYGKIKENFDYEGRTLNRLIEVEGFFLDGKKSGTWLIFHRNFWWNVEFKSGKIKKIIRRWDRFGNYYEGNYDLKTWKMSGEALLFRKKYGKYYKIIYINDKVKKILYYYTENGDIYIGSFNNKYEADGCGIYYKSDTDILRYGIFYQDEILNFNFIKKINNYTFRDYVKNIMQFYVKRNDKFKKKIINMTRVHGYSIYEDLKRFINELKRNGDEFDDNNNFLFFIRKLNLHILLFEQKFRKINKRKISTLQVCYKVPDKENISIKKECSI